MQYRSNIRRNALLLSLTLLHKGQLLHAAALGSESPYQHENR